MKFLLNVNISPVLGEMLLKKGHSYRHVSLLGKHKATDTEIIDIAKSNNEIIITHDLDYGTLLSFSGNSSPSVIIFRIHKINSKFFFNLLMNNWKLIETPLLQGALIIIEQDKIRIRKLPIMKI